GCTGHMACELRCYRVAQLTDDVVGNHRPCTITDQALQPSVQGRIRLRPEVRRTGQQPHAEAAADQMPHRLLYQAVQPEEENCAGRLSFTMRGNWQAEPEGNAFPWLEPQPRPKIGDIFLRLEVVGKTLARNPQHLAQIWKTFKHPAQGGLSHA